jgi:hypothetical protein
VLGTATGRSSQGAGSKRTLHHVRLKEGSERKMRVKIKPVNDMAVSDEHLNIIILKKSKRRYRQIIKAHYRRMQKKEVKES